MYRNQGNSLARKPSQFQYVHQSRFFGCCGARRGGFPLPKSKQDLIVEYPSMSQLDLVETVESRRMVGRRIYEKI